MVVWDYIATLGTRMVAEESGWAIPLASATTFLWWSAIAFPRGRVMGVCVILGATIGTALGILWP